MRLRDERWILLLVLPLLTWLIQGAVGPALVGLPVGWAATDLARAAGRWFRRLRRSDGLSRIVQSVSGDIDLSDAEFTAVRRLLEEESTWAEVGRGTVEDLAMLIASCLQGRAIEGSLAAGRAIAGGLLEFAVRDLEPEWFRQVLFARLDRMEADQASALDQAMLSVHADLAAMVAHRDVVDAGRYAWVMGQLLRVLDRLPPGPADKSEVAVYLATLVRWLNSDPWPQDTRFAGPALTPAAIERKLRIAGGRSHGGQDLDADDLAQECARLVVLGAPGSGKTWLARRAARMCAEAALEALVAGALPDEIELPLYTTCAWLTAVPPNYGIRRAVVMSALGQLPDLGGARVLGALRALFEERDARTLLVVDSLDEAHGADDRVRQADTLPPTWRIVLTSRQASWNRQLAIGADGSSRLVGVLQPLRYPDDVEPFIARWFVRQPAWARGLTAQLRHRPALQRAATVPLILAFYCIVGSDQPLPGRRADLYAKVIRRMLTGRWRGSGDRDPDPDACLEILRDWAWSAAASKTVSGVGVWADEFRTSRVRQSQDDRDALDHVAAPLGLPDADSAMTRRRFVHRSLREHLVAEHIALRMPADETVEELLNHLWYDPDWEYAAPAALAMHPQRDQVLTELIRRVTRDDRLPADLPAIDGCWEIRRFLTRLALESGEVDWSPISAEMIGQARLDVSVSWHDNLRAELTSEWPASNNKIIDSLLGQLANEPTPWKVQMLAGGVAKLAMTMKDPVRPREELLVLLASETSPGRARALAGGVAQLDPSAQDRARASAALLGILARDTDPGTSRGLVDSIARLAHTPEDRTRASETLLTLLADETSPKTARALAKAITRLAVTVDERARARKALVERLTSEISSGAAQGLAADLARLAPLPEERTQGMDALLTLLARETSPTRARGLAKAIAQLARTEKERARAREALLTLLTSENSPKKARELGKAVAMLAVTAEERAHVREALLTSEPDPRRVQALASTIARLARTPEDRTQSSEALLALLATETEPARTKELAGAIARLARTPEDRRQALETLLMRLATESSPSSAQRLADAVVRLDPEPIDRARATEALLALLAKETDPGIALGLANVVVRLDPEPIDRARATEALLALLATETNPGTARGLADAVLWLDPESIDRARATEALLALLAIETSPLRAQRLAHAVARLAATAEDRARAREAMLALLTRETDPRRAHELADAIAELTPTVSDLGGSESWQFPPTPALLAATRQNSGLQAWLAALPRLSSQVDRS